MPADTSLVAALAAVAPTFGPSAAAEKTRLLAAIAAADAFAVRDLRKLLDVVCFLTAYPDSAAVRKQTRRVAARLREFAARTRRDGTCAQGLIDIGFPGGINTYPFGLPVLQTMQRSFADCFTIDWDSFSDESMLQHFVGLFLTPAEFAGLDSIELTMGEWVAGAKPPEQTDIGFLQSLFESTGLDPISTETMWQASDIPLRYEMAREGTARCEVLAPDDNRRICYQRAPLRTERIPLARAIRAGVRVEGPLDARRGRAFVEFALASLCARNLEIRTLMFANDRDVHVVDCGRGLRIILMGVVPAYRDGLEAHYCCLVVKNDIAIAYGPASVHFGHCELGLNLFPEYRSGEIRWIYPQYMRAIHHVLGAHLFYLTSYGMGDGNPEAIQSGAFWFYRKLGFRAANPTVEALARTEEQRMRDQPGYRSNRRTLLRLAKTDAFFDLEDSPDAAQRADAPIGLETAGLRISRILGEKFHGDRPAFEAECTRSVARSLELESEIEREIERETAGPWARALRLLAPFLWAATDLPNWSKADKRRMRRILRAKAAPSEARVDRLLSEHTTLRAELHAFTAAHEESGLQLRDRGRAIVEDPG